MAATALAIYAVDQLTKHVAIGVLGDGRVVPIIGDLFTLRLVRNPGAAFSMGSGFTIALSVLSLVVFIALVGFVMWRVRGVMPGLACAFLTGGVAGNLTDRLVRPPGVLTGHVIDFLSLRGFAVFNVADIAITSAAILLVIWSIRKERSE